jgi:hypothetical protein
VHYKSVVIKKNHKRHSKKNVNSNSLIINKLPKCSKNFLAKNGKKIWWNEKVVVPLPRICPKGHLPPERVKAFVYELET